MRGRRLRFYPLYFILGFVLCGCGGSGSGTAPIIVKGKVTLDNQPLSGGSVIFTLATDPKIKLNAIVGKDGNYQATFTTPGSNWKVSIQGQGPSSDPKEKRIPVIIPSKYLDPKTSELSFSALQSDKTFDIALKK